MQNLGWKTCSMVWAALAACGCAVHGAPKAQARGGKATESAQVEPSAALNEATIIELANMREQSSSYAWFQFKPNVKKLLLSGSPDSRHISVLWYGHEGKAGAVPLHYHEKTESIFVIDGAQTDGKGTYGKGSFYFNPPGSGHDISNSSGLFLLSYAAPPDFERSSEIGAYENVVIGPDYATLPLTPCHDGSLCYAPALAERGGIRSRFVQPQASALTLTANVLLVLKGSCRVAGQILKADTLLVGKSSDPATYELSAPQGDCLLFELAFAE